MAYNLKYINRKKSELDWISNRLNIPLSKGKKKIENLEEISKEKLALRAKSISEFYKENHATETNIFTQDKKLVIGEYKISYQYQRFDMDISGPCPYPILNTSAFSSRQFTSFYFSSGMSAILSFALALSRIKVCNWLVIGQSDTYFETQVLFNELFKNIQTYWGNSKSLYKKLKTSKKNTAKILWCDSICEKALSFSQMTEKDLNQVSLICYDTTCELSNSPLIKSLFELSDLSKIPLILLRSHLKLDFMGFEYSRLGSMVFYLPKECPPQTEKLLRILEELVKDVTKLSGTCCNPLALFLNLDKEGAKLNKLRVRLIKENNNAFYSQLVKKNYSIKKYDHGLFTTIHLSNFDKTENDIIEFSKSCQKKGLPVYYGTSFGLDVILLVLYKDLNNNDTIIRVSISDLPDEMIESFINEVNSNLL